MLVPILGYLPSTVLFAVFLALRTGFRGARTVGIAALFGVFVTVVFRAFLQVKIPAGDVYVDGGSVGDVGNVVLRDRASLAQSGFVTCSVAIDDVTPKSSNRC